VTRTAVRTRILLTQPLVVTLWTLRPAVTQMIRVHTDLRVQTAIEPWALITVTVILVLPALAVEPAIASREHRHAGGDRTRTAVVSIGARVVWSKLLLGKVTMSVVVNDIRRAHACLLDSRFQVVGTVLLVHNFIQVVKTV
jgi:hypothetical protein